MHLRQSLCDTKYIAMSTQQAALEHLRVIRSLMEKAHIYRAISAPAALLGGILAAAASGRVLLQAQVGQGIVECSEMSFLIEWLAILAVTAAVNVLLLARDAGRRGQPFVSEGMRAALKTLLPPLLVGGVLGIGLIVHLHNLTLAALLWVMCYGLALLATRSFSPRSLVRLGWMFVACGLALFWLWAASSDIRLLSADVVPASAVMGVTFGLLHIGYAVAVFVRRKPEPEVLPE